MRKGVGFLFSCLIVWGLLSGCNRQWHLPRAENGVIDLRDWDFSTRGNIRLDGDWAFYWGQMIPPETIGRLPASLASSRITVPDVWNDHREMGMEIGGMGVGTYHLRVLLPDQPQVLGLKILEAGTASAFYVDGETAGGGGMPGTTAETSHPLYRPSVAGLGSKSGTMDIVVHVSNFHHWQGGLWEPLQLGLMPDIVTARERALLLTLFLFGSVIIMGLYHLVLFWGRRENLASLYFGFFCFAIAVRLMSTGERFWFCLIQPLGFRTEVLLEYLSFYVCVPLFVLYARSLFPWEVSRHIVRGSVVSALLFSLITLAAPIAVFSRILPVFQVVTLGLVGAGVVAGGLAIARKREGAIVFLAGFFILGIAVFNDVLHSRQIISTGYFAPSGLFAFIFSQAFMLSQRFSKAFVTVEAQWRDLDIANQAYQTELLSRVQAEEGLKASEAQYRQLIEDSADGICIIKKQVIVYANQRLLDLCAMAKEEMVGRSFLPLVYPEDREKVLARYQTPLVRDGESGHFAARGLDSKGRILFFELNGCPIRWEGETAVMTIVRDVTEQTRTRELLVQSEKMLSVGGLAAGMAHEINNPLAGMIQSAQLIGNRLTPGPVRNREVADRLGLDLDQVAAYARERGVLKLLDNIQAAGKGAADIVANMLSFSRKPDQGRQRCRMEDIVEKALALVKNDFQLKRHFRDIRISRIYAPDLPSVLCEETKIRQVLVNLLKNAAQALNTPGFTIAEPSIEIRITQTGGTLTLVVRDNGPGMDESTRRRIFEPFFTTKPVDSGTGLGLSISYFIITEDHQGRMDVRSAMGEGTEFMIQLPLS